MGANRWHRHEFPWLDGDDPLHRIHDNCRMRTMGFKEAMKQAGVLDTPTIYFLESID